MVLKIAHRGISSFKQENSISSFKEAIKLGIEVVEFDIRLTKDNQIIIMHDNNIKRTTNGKGLIKDLTLKELKKFYGLNNNKIPTFQQVINILGNKCICKIDIKEKRMEDKIIEIIKKKNMEDSIIITSKILPVIKKIKKLCPKIKTEAGGFKSNIPIEKIIKKAKNVNADIIGTHYSITTKKLVEKAHKNKLEVHVWPVNNKRDMEKMKRINVDGVTTTSAQIEIGTTRRQLRMSFCLSYRDVII